jgi:hypothetical protein
MPLPPSRKTRALLAYRAFSRGAFLANNSASSCGKPRRSARLAALEPVEAATPLDDKARSRVARTAAVVASESRSVSIDMLELGPARRWRLGEGLDRSSPGRGRTYYRGNVLEKA